MSDETITFEFVRKVQHEEQKTQKLSKLPENFYDSVAAYIQQKRKLNLNSDRKGAFEFKNIERLVEYIFNTRERKILNLATIAAQTGIPPENLTDDERTFFDALTYIIKKRRNENLEKMVGKSKEEMGTLIVFREEVPEFLGSDMKTYGPFKKGDIAKLPEENMHVMVQQGVAEEFKVSK